jgi:hypothetical protein
VWREPDGRFLPAPPRCAAGPLGHTAAPSLTMVAMAARGTARSGLLDLHDPFRCFGVRRIGNAIVDVPIAPRQAGGRRGARSPSLQPNRHDRGKEGRRNF